MELLRTELHEATRLLHSADFLKKHCSAVGKLLVNINTRYLGMGQKFEPKQNRFYEAFSTNPDLCFSLTESLSRLKLFLYLYVIPLRFNEKYDILRKCWVFLNSASLQKTFCLKVRNIYSLCKKCLSRASRKSFEEDYKTIIGRSVSRKQLVKSFNNICPKLNSYHAINKVVVKSINAFFFGLNEMLKARHNGCAAPNILNIPQDEAIADTNRLVSAIEFEMLAALKIKPTKEIDIIECMQRFRSEGLGRMVFEAQPMSLGLRTTQNEIDFDIFEVIQEISLLSSKNANNMLLPAKYTFTDGFCFVFQNIKIPLSSVLCDNQRHALYDFTTIEALCIIKSIGLALDTIHDFGFVHNAIHADNVYLIITRSDHGQRETVVKVSNFIVNQMETVEWKNEGYKQDDLQYLEKIIFTAPEVFLDNENLRSNDIYATGMLLWQLLHFKKEPLSALLRTIRKNKSIKDNTVSINSSNMLNKIPKKVMARRIKRELANGLRPKISTVPVTINRKRLIPLLNEMWGSDSTKRPSAKTLVEKTNNLLNMLLPSNYTEKSVINAMSDNLRNGENIELKGLNTEKAIKAIPTAEESVYNESIVSIRTDNSKLSRNSAHLRKQQSRGKLGKNTLRSSNTLHSNSSKTWNKKRRISRFSTKRITNVFGPMKPRKSLIDQIERDDEEGVSKYADQAEVDRALFNEMSKDFDDTRTLASIDNRTIVDDELNTSFKLL